MNLDIAFLGLVQPLASVMTAPSFANFVSILTGWVFASRRTVTGMILAAGLAGERHHSIFHRFFARAAWSLDDLGLTVFALIEPWLNEGNAGSACPRRRRCLGKEADASQCGFMAGTNDRA